jgi:signal transduction histidine kinase/DNA-binding response OmpR family regulator
MEIGNNYHATNTLSRRRESNNGHRLLLIEDNMGDARFLELMLEDTNFEVSELVHCTTLEDGINTFADNFDVVFLDLSLPDSRGIVTLERFLSAHHKAGVIVMTGFSDQETGISAVRGGAQDFLIKGEYEADKLLCSIYYTIERNKILHRFEEAQRIAKIGSWEVKIKSKEIFFSDNIYAIFSVPSLGKRIKYDTNERFKGHAYFPLFLNIHQEVYTLFEAGNREGIHREIELITPEGRKIISVKCYITGFEEESPIYYGIIQDISEQKLAEKLIQEQKFNEESVKLKEEFITNVSHEMRTPMNAILGMTNILLGTPTSREQNDCLLSVKQSSEMLLGIVNDILDFSSLQNGKITYEQQPFNLFDVLTNLAEVMQYKIAEKDLSFELNITNNDIPRFIISDKLRLNQVLYNLVGNAIKFTERGYVKLWINILSNENNKITLQFCVEDTGIGIPNDKLEAIFGSFTRIINKDKLYEGTGLGLAIAKNIVLQQGGKIWAESELGKGSKFYFNQTFEIALDQTQQNIKDNDGRKDFNIDPTRPFKLLLVEDNKLNQIVAKKTLEKQWQNIKLTIAENGQKAVDALEIDAFDIILMDIQMPVMDGYEATEHIRKNMPQHHKTPILAMTAFAHIAKEEKFKEFGLDDFVLKPFEPEDLYNKVAIYTNNI